MNVFVEKRIRMYDESRARQELEEVKVDILQRRDDVRIEVDRPGSEDRRILVDETVGTENLVPAHPKDVFDGLPAELKPLVSHWVE